MFTINQVLIPFKQGRYSNGRTIKDQDGRPKS